MNMGKVLVIILQVIFLASITGVLLLGIAAIIISSVDVISEYFEDRKFKKRLRELDKKKRSKQ